LISISEDEVDGFENYSNKSIIYNTVDLELVERAKKRRGEKRSELGIKESEFVIGFAANVTEKKGAWDFLELCKEMKNQENLKFLLVGKLHDKGKTNLGNGIISELSPKAYVESFISEHNLEEQIILTGFRTDNLELIAAMDLLIVPNKNGVLGRQPIEAQALGTPVIAQIGHSLNSNIILNNKTGYLVNNIQQAILKATAIIDNKTASIMAEEAQEYANTHFNPIINMQKIENIYINLITN
jgi:glycosyltransferase involved in cell wall biosynthesis